MRIPRIYSPQSLADCEQLELPEAPSRHLLKALRMEPGRELILFDGSGGEYQAVLVEGGKRAQVRLGAFSPENHQSPLELTLAIGISRGDRFDWVIQKATELGVSAIQPLWTARCEVRLSGERLQKKLAHWRQIAASACEQCQRNLLPTVAEPVKLAQYMREAQSDLKLVLHHRSERDLRQLEKARGVPASALLLVGPEGGLSPQEIDTALACDFAPLRLGPRVLRTETAPVAALSVLQFHWGDL